MADHEDQFQNFHAKFHVIFIMTCQNNKALSVVILRRSPDSIAPGNRAICVLTEEVCAITQGFKGFEAEGCDAMHAGCQAAAATPSRAMPGLALRALPAALAVAILSPHPCPQHNPIFHHSQQVYCT